MLLKLLKVPKTCHPAVSKPNRNSLQGLEAAYLDAKASTGGATAYPAQASVDGFELLKLFKVAF